MKDYGKTAEKALAAHDFETWAGKSSSRPLKARDPSAKRARKEAAISAVTQEIIIKTMITYFCNPTKNHYPIIPR
jgi:hypothetical protein